MSLGKADDNCIQINDIKRVTFGISDTCKNGKKENLGKNRLKRECGEGNEGIEQENSAKDPKSRRRGSRKIGRKKIFEDKVVAQTTKKSVIPCLSRFLKLQVSNSGLKKG